MCIVPPLALALALLDKGRGPTKPVESSFRADLFSSSSWSSLSSFSPTPPGQDLPACWRGGDTSERINQTNERVRQTAVNGVVGHLRSGSTFGSVVLLCNGDKRKPEEGGAAPPPPPTPPYDEIKGDRERGDGQKVPILSTRKHTHAREINREETVIGIYIYCFQRD